MMLLWRLAQHHLDTFLIPGCQLLKVSSRNYSARVNFKLFRVVQVALVRAFSWNQEEESNRQYFKVTESLQIKKKKKKIFPLSFCILFSFSETISTSIHAKKLWCVNAIFYWKPKFSFSFSYKSKKLHSSNLGQIYIRYIYISFFFFKWSKRGKLGNLLMELLFFYISNRNLILPFYHGYFLALCSFRFHFFPFFPLSLFSLVSFSNDFTNRFW